MITLTILCGLLHFAAMTEGMYQKPVVSEETQGSNKLVETLTRQLMLQQLAVEESRRTDGNSGIKQIRTVGRGTRPYHSASHVDSGDVSAIHDHADHYRTVGMGEVAVVLNGVEFRTRHNDYQLVMPSRTSTGYHAVEDIPFPDVPPSVLAKATVADQAAEMREYFRAFKSQNSSIRDYKPYFKPILCYLEGAWHETSQDNIDESFFSDRHFLDAKSWTDLHERIQFRALTGRKDASENSAFLPTRVMGFNGSDPIIAQWNYRILCHPLRDDLPTSAFKVVDEMKPRVQTYHTYQELASTRQARFQLQPGSNNVEEAELLPIDRLMMEVPGPENYPGSLTDKVGEETALNVDDRSTPLNSAYYHRAYAMAGDDAMGLEVAQRSFSDETIHMAMTNHEQVASVSMNTCTADDFYENVDCSRYVTQRWSYAIPLEIIYLTPLSRWNPYTIEYRGDEGTEEGEKVRGDGDRDGGFMTSTAYDGNNNAVFYRTPAEFFTGSGGSDPADTDAAFVGVLDRDGNVRNVSASGVRITLPEVAGVGTVRQRYPVMPVHAEGSATWKEVAALSDVINQLPELQFLLRNPLPGGSDGGGGEGGDGEEPDVGGEYFLIQTTTLNPPGEHSHTVFLTWEEQDYLYDSEDLSAVVEVTSSRANGHNHRVRVGVNPDTWDMEIRKCDNMAVGAGCWDAHPLEILETSGAVSRRRRRSLQARRRRL